jgi:hypothetical protein
MNSDVIELKKMIKTMLDHYVDMVSDKFDGKSFEETEVLKEKEADLIKTMNYLSALYLVGDFENIDMSMSRELIAYHKTLVEPIVDLQPSGEESATIRLWTGSSGHHDKYETKHQLQ